MFKLSQQIVSTKQHEVVQKAQKFGHIILYSEYESNLVHFQSLSVTEQKNFRFQSERKAVFYLRCLLHNNGKIQKTTICNYLRSRTGLSCCGLQKVSKKLQNRTFSQAPKQKMS